MFKYDDLEKALRISPSSPEAYYTEVVWNAALGRVRNMIAGAADAEATTRDLVVLLLTEIEFLTTDLHYGNDRDTETINKLLAKDGAAEKPKPAPTKPPLTLEMQWDGDVLYVRGVEVARLAGVERQRGQWVVWYDLPAIGIDGVCGIHGKAKARKIAEKGVIDWFERMTGEPS